MEKDNVALRCYVRGRAWCVAALFVLFAGSACAESWLRVPGTKAFDYEKDSIVKTSTGARVWTRAVYEQPTKVLLPKRDETGLPPLKARVFISLRQFDCADRTEQVLRSRFLWDMRSTVALAQDGPQDKDFLVPGSDTERVFRIVCAR